MTEVPGAVGPGQPQVTTDPPRVERSRAISGMASLMSGQVRAQDLPERGPWRIVTLKRHVRRHLAQAPLGRSVAQHRCQEHQQRRAA
ncbi:MAG: hypothetical protein M3361_10475 [Candidatus Tectomicrobia bacterium]|nr:hypothetical protein [Candidatus Tectomicrobia bacterium]